MNPVAVTKEEKEENAESLGEIIDRYSGDDEETEQD
jgi:hypothetical protein